MFVAVISILAITVAVSEIVSVDSHVVVLPIVVVVVTTIVVVVIVVVLEIVEAVA